MNEQIVSGRRLIKLKEWGLNIDSVKTCKQEQRGIAAGSTFTLRTDENGFIKTGNPVLEDGSPVVFLGDSFTECMFVPEGRRFPDVCERIWREKYGQKVNVCNAAMSGSNMLHCIFTVLAKAIPLKPRLVVLCLPSMDYKTSRLEHSYWTNDKNVSIFYGREKTEELFKSDFEKSRYIEMLNVITYIIDTFGIDVVVCSHPYFDINDKRHKINAMAYMFCSENKINYIDMKDILKSQVEAMFYDKVHMHEEGCSIFGKVLAEQIMEKKLLSCN